MPKTFGNYVNSENIEHIESLYIKFSPSCMPIQQRWRNNGLSADFLGDYVTSFYPKNEVDDKGGSRKSEIKSAVSYIANELLENAMKYVNKKSDQFISLTLYLTSKKIVFELSNAITLDQESIFISFIEKLKTSDAGELYMQRLEENAMTGKSSGLGCLSIINDYGAEFSWCFNHENKKVNTQIVIII